MSEYTAVQVRGLGKEYHIGGPRRSYSTIRETITDSLAAPFRRAGRLLRGHASAAGDLNETIWALREISFDIGQGEVVGIIGRNGAGKSTLLKILSRITEPNEGFAEIRGRVGSLLEVGTGFHPELTGRENIFLNGAILGMRKGEIDARFDEIVDFAEIEKFIDTPVKHYSSGMYVRLAFAVAAHLEPEILIVDEVLSVGDAAFQKKCLGKMEDVGKGGRTVLFVSHNMPAVTRLCERTILLDGGRILKDGPSHAVVGAYLSSGLGTTAAREWDDPATAPGGEVARLRAVRVRDEGGSVTEAIDIRRPVTLEMEFEVLRPGWRLVPHYHVFNDEGVHLFGTFDQTPEWRGRPRPPGRYLSRARVPGNLLAEGTIFVNACLARPQPFTAIFTARDAVAFQVIDTLEGNSARGDWGRRIGGVMRPLLEWETEFLDGSLVTTLMAESG